MRLRVSCRNDLEGIEVMDNIKTIYNVFEMPFNACCSDLDEIFYGGYHWAKNNEFKMATMCFDLPELLTITD